MRLQLGAVRTLRVTALLLLLSSAGVRADDEEGWRLSADTLFYSDSDNVRVVSPQVSVRRTLDADGGSAGARVVVDSVSAASVDVISQASTRFSEVRTEADLDVSKRVGAYLPSLSYRVSHEPDYDSQGAGAGLQRQLGGADTTLAVDYHITFDTVGYAGTPRSSFSESLLSQYATASLTQVLGPKTLVRCTYTLSDQYGYQEKPYRFVPLFDQAAIDAAREDGVKLDLSTFDQYRLDLRPTEEVPSLRVGHALGLRALRYLPGLPGAFRVDAQAFVDSWGVRAGTFEPTLSWKIAEGVVVTAYARLYGQRAASFWRRTYVVDGPTSVPIWRTIDRDLSTYTTTGGGFRAEWTAGWLSGYVDASLSDTVYSNYLFLTSRWALVAQAGVRLHI